MSAEGLLDDPALFARRNDEKSNQINKSNDSMENNEINGRVKKSVNKSDTDHVKDKKSVKTDIVCPDKLHLGLEYLELVDKYPVKMKSVIFHIRRICREEFTDYQLMEDCVSCKTTDELKKVIREGIEYKINNNFTYDKNKEKRAKEILEKRKREEGKRKPFEDRMIRKAKRDKKEDLHFYLAQGAENPSIEKLNELKKLPKEIGFEIWKNNYSQHCYNFHFEVVGCHRDRTCSFLHHDTSFADENAVAYG